MIDKVSLCIVVYNEGHRIYNTLVQALATVDNLNEIVIVDQESTDNTYEQVKEFISHSGFSNLKWVPDKHWGYCEASRELAHSKVTNDWILVLDADECVSYQFAQQMLSFDETGFLGARLKRSLYVGDEHKFTGDYQYRFFHHNAVRYLNELHTEPQPTIDESKIMYPDYIGIYHHKSWVEQIRDEQAYASLIDPRDKRHKHKLSLNVYSKILEDAGVTAEQADAMTPEERKAMGII